MRLIIFMGLFLSLAMCFAVPSMATTDCPDTDQDGVADAVDECPDTPIGSLVDSKGCSEPVVRDMDGDDSIGMAEGIAIIQSLSGARDTLVERCSENAECGDSQYCQKRDGDCPGSGVCQDTPDACPDIWAPVCGCDGSTYGNECEAAAAGVSVDYEGNCVSRCSDSGDCAPGTVCNKPVGACDSPGDCMVAPGVCSSVYAPVCSCDGITFTNSCVAVRAGRSIAYSGECTTPCDDNTDCDSYSFCNKVDGECGSSGTCERRPSDCPDIYDPVCTCDRVTVPNACQAYRMARNVAYTGPCRPTCSSNSQCEEGYYCQKESGNCSSDGLCQPIPAGCLPLGDPVCGCDGVTYSNPCWAARNEVSINYEGYCPTPCDSNGDCASSQYCQRTEGDCSGPGSCETPPTACPDNLDPVCGCDGNTYDNACKAAEARVNVAYTGTCVANFCRNNSHCGDTQYCAKGTDECDSPGTCTDLPAACPDVYDPVCGCDDRTYPNACYAALNGVTVRFDGSCLEHCTSNTECSSGYFCYKVRGCTEEGTCRPMPTACPDIELTVCGCDGNTYSDYCEADAAGVNVEYEGECVATCTDNSECPANNYCRKPDERCDLNGTCEPKPTACPAILDPVCGCDGVTYTNSCQAAGAGVTVAYRGECDTSCTSNDGCHESQYCRKATGSCGAEGDCSTKPSMCPDMIAPVCGCDGNTYNNSCEAAQAGINVLYDGRCVITCTVTPETGQSTCDPDYYCHVPWGDCGVTGDCRAVPTTCSDFYDPVCGCDGVTYDNWCVAAKSGKQVTHDGKCITPCDSDDDCSGATFCEKPAGECNASGQCQTPPADCPDMIAPVCGCDGVSYENACLAKVAGASVEYEGECITGCTGNGDCGANEICLKDAGECNDNGYCIDKPTACPDIMDPVCGCDGVTYDNVCEARQAGVNMEYKGACVAKCNANSDCESGDYCEKNEGDCWEEGVCKKKPESCSGEQDFVCGCDANSYDNACQAAKAGVNIDHTGACTMCGTNDPCQGQNEYCEIPVGDCGMVGYGQCLQMPDTCPDTVDQVCGCDQNTYDNACKAIMAGVAIKNLGPCQ